LKVHNLSKKDIKELNNLIDENFNIESFFDKKELIKKYLDKQNNINRVFYATDNIMFIKIGGVFFPSLKNLLNNNFLKQIKVDMKAVKFVTNGADIMRPGIVDIDAEIEADSIISVCDETHEKPLCVGRALFSGVEIEALEKGKVIKNLHYISDELWNLKL
jgi:PUA-domain protein